eukprot:COSAG01_NODE_937_length_12628_cov_12.665257_15_plen_62_part_00
MTRMTAASGANKEHAAAPARPAQPASAASMQCLSHECLRPAAAPLTLCAGRNMNRMNVVIE